MYSSRMRTVCQGGVSAQGVYTSPRGQTDTCENIAFPQLLLQTVNIKCCTEFDTTHVYRTYFRTFAWKKVVRGHEGFNRIPSSETLG